MAVVGKGRDELVWTVRDDVKKSEVETQKEYYSKLGVKGFDFNSTDINHGDSKYERIDFMKLLQHLLRATGNNNVNI